jgi:hypothetical protein
MDNSNVSSSTDFYEYTRTITIKVSKDKQREYYLKRKNEISEKNKQLRAEKALAEGRVPGIRGRYANRVLLVSEN